MLAFLGFADNRQDHLLREACDNRADYFNLTKREQKELLHENINL